MKYRWGPMLFQTPLPPLQRSTGRPWRKALFWYYPHYSNQGGRPTMAMRYGEWKLIEWFEDGRQVVHN